MLNQQIGNYKFLSILGEGGMATVYLAQNVLLDSYVAIKVLKEEFVSNNNIRSRFIDEAKKMAKVKHPNIILVMDMIISPNEVAIIMEYAEGMSLKDYLLQQVKLSDEEIEKMMCQMLDALQHIHNFGYVHRDIKPSNFMLNKEGNIKLADFGIAKDMNSIAVTQTSTQMGTPMYMSPEQIKSTKDVDHRSDIFSLGIVLYEMVSGTYPFDKENLSLFEIQMHISQNPLPLTNTFWDEQIKHATAKQVEDRIQSCEHWLNSLKSKSLHRKTQNNDATVFESIYSHDKTLVEEHRDNLNSIKIGKQIWMTENLNVDKFRNGDPIPEAKTSEEWKNAGINGKPAWCFYCNENENGDKFGKLYNWYAVNDSRGLAPEGWHIPSDTEWTELTEFLEGPYLAGKKMKNSSGWIDYEGNVGNGNDLSGFSGLPGGYRDYTGFFGNVFTDGFWWSKTEYDDNSAHSRNLNINFDDQFINCFNKEEGMSVRCIED
jgi:uncharacterized protein (TIGR02145 family)